MTTKMKVDFVPNAFGLYDLPDEILLPMMIHLDDSTLFNMTLVCHRFRAIAKEAFSKKYTGDGDKFFNLEVNGTNAIADKTEYHPFFATFGENMAAIHINYSDPPGTTVDRNHWLIDEIQNCCTTLTHFCIVRGGKVNLTEFIRWVPSLSHLYLENMTLLSQSWSRFTYPRLVCFHMSDVDWEEKHLIQFISKNPQLEELNISDNFMETNMDFVYAFAKLPKLKSLRLNFHGSEDLEEQSSLIKMDSLTAFQIFTSDASCMQILKAMKPCQNLVKIDMRAFGSWDESVFITICQFKKLESLKISAYDLKLKHLKQIVEQLPNLSKLKLADIEDDDDSEIYDNLLQTIWMCIKLSQLEISFDDDDDWPEFDYHFIAELAEITKRNSLKITLESFNTPSNRLTSHNGEVRHRDAVLFWSGYDPIHSHSRANLLDLNEKCLQKIISLLNITDQSALFNTCTRTQQAVKNIVLQSTLQVSLRLMSMRSLKEDVFQTLGQYIHRVRVKEGFKRVDQEATYYISAFELYKHLNQYCSNLVELNAENIDEHIFDLFNHPWPNVNKIKITSCNSEGYENLCGFDCPKLTHLEIGYIELDAHPMRLDHENCFKHLTVLKFGCYNDSVDSFLMGLDDDICQQMQELQASNITSGYKSKNKKDEEDEDSDGSIPYYRRVRGPSNQHLVRLVTRFRNLSTLRLLVRGVEKNNTQLIFENCAKLVHLSICCNESSAAMFGQIKKNCKQIESIGIVSEPKSNAFERNFLKKVYGLFPKGVVELFYSDGKTIFPITVDLTADIPSSLNFSY
ncbi:uncharacterized protein LOC129565502 [Sitodiplosis mosellana]|uniref:uncharacterized protein LOC129565502 n=1 Tax=Sitodiplosis mosellana TaxID=263140 RepID=UPI002443E690|nr:uncharacterized protein LOC129565502 [Sitodiplosis mosellana]